MSGFQNSGFGGFRPSFAAGRGQSGFAPAEQSKPFANFQPKPEFAPTPQAFVPNFSRTFQPKGFQQASAPQFQTGFAPRQQKSFESGPNEQFQGKKEFSRLENFGKRENFESGPSEQFQNKKDFSRSDKFGKRENFESGPSERLQGKKEFSRPEKFGKRENEGKGFNKFQPRSFSGNSQQGFEGNKRFEKNPQFEQPREEFQEDWNEIEAELKAKALSAFNRNKSKQKVPAPISQTIRIASKAYSKDFAEESKLKEQPKPVFRQTANETTTSNKSAKASVQDSKNIVYKPKDIKPPTGAGQVVMCSMEESQSREESNQLSIFEKVPGTNEHNPEWTIKKYLRSSADREEYKRTPNDLSGALSYLTTQILDVDTNGNPNHYDFQDGCDSHTFQDIYPFLFDRMRAIVKDWKMLKVSDSDEYVKDHESIARFLILSCVEGLVSADFNLNLNLKLTEDVLNCLIRTYERRRNKFLPCPNQAEFISYFIITKPDNMLQILTTLKNLPKQVVNSRYVQLALCILANYHNEDFEEFFNTVYDSPHLLACAAYPLFHKIRPVILAQMEENSTREVSLELFSQLLGFGDEDEARMYIEEFELEIADHSDPGKAIVKISQVPEKKSQIFSVVPAQVVNKCTFGSRLEAISAAEDLGGDEEQEEEEERVAEKVESPVRIIGKVESVKEVQEVVEEKKKEVLEVFKDSYAAVLQEVQKKIEVFDDRALIEFTAPTPKIVEEEKKVEEPKKKFFFQFPFEDKNIFSIVQDKNEKNKIKENIRNYRTEKKLREKAKNRQHESLMKLKVMKAWKGYTAGIKLEKYLERRKVHEMELFRAQFTNLIISDTVCHQRYLYLNESQFPTSGSLFNSYT